MRILVCGGQDYRDRERVADVLYPIVKRLLALNAFEGLIEGGAKGADRLARDWAKSWDLPVITFEADWDRYGKSAGLIRNQQMLDEGKPDLVVAFPGGRGTAHMVARAKKAGVRVIEAT